MTQQLEAIGTLPGELERVIARLRDSGWAELAPDKRAFALSYVKNLSHVTSAEEIGKRGKGLTYLRDPLVRAMISDIQEEYAKVSIINRHMVEAKMLETLEKLEGNVAVPMVSASGVAFEDRKFHSGEVINLLKEMGKISGIVQEKEHTSNNISIKIDMGALVGDTAGITIDNPPQ